MFTKYKQISYRPAKPILVWDSDCTFCKYWMLRWRNLTDDKVIYEPYQKVAAEITGIPRWAFKEAIRLIETDGKVYDGPHAAYQALTYSKQWSELSKFYVKHAFFRFISDHGYVFIANHRSLMFFFTRLLWGSDPLNPNKYRIIYLACLLILLLIILITYNYS